MASEFTVQQFAHYNGGSDWSGTSSKVFKDGVETHIIRNVRTDGSPKYKVTHDYFQSGADVYDLMNRPEMKLLDWLEQQTKDLPANDNPKT